MLRSIWYAEGKIRHNIATDVDIEIFGADGRSALRCESASQSVDVSDLPSGVYIVRANFRGRTIEEKIVVR
ncbi:MAG: T9SS type A sorting domain-containing protein [Muribaculaceae bacterium]|nr:T9SS type A sorting domain-containing protein [Muribaculaceae bacterium]